LVSACACCYGKHAGVGLAAWFIRLHLAPVLQMLLGIGLHTACVLRMVKSGDSCHYSITALPICSHSYTPGWPLQWSFSALWSETAACVAPSFFAGSLYYLTFCAAKRAATKMVAKSEQTQAASTAAAAAGAAALSTGLTINTTRSSSSSGGGHSNSGTPHAYPHGSGADLHCHDAVFAAICSDDKAAHQQHHTPASARSAAVAGSGAASVPTSSSTTSSSSSQTPELSSHGKLQANVLAACAAAVVGALVEAPVELFKHRAQAGQIQGSMVAAVTSALKQHGPAALYGSFFIPFLFKSLPFDIGELMTYSSLNDWRAAAVQKAAPAAPAAAAAVTPAKAAASAAADSSLAVETPILGASSGMPALASLTAASIGNSSSGGLLNPVQFVSNMPDHVWDMAVGAAAGAAAVLISMPADCIKTVMVSGGWTSVDKEYISAGKGLLLVVHVGHWSSALHFQWPHVVSLGHA
jgi:hypothetical protein